MRLIEEPCVPVGHPLDSPLISLLVSWPAAAGDWNPTRLQAVKHRTLVGVEREREREGDGDTRLRIALRMSIMEDRVSTVRVTEYVHRGLSGPCNNRRGFVILPILGV